VNVSETIWLEALWTTNPHKAEDVGICALAGASRFYLSPISYCELSGLTYAGNGEFDNAEG